MNSVLILIFDRSWGLTVKSPRDRPARCEITTDLYRLPEANAIVFHIPSAPNLKRVPKYPGQKWVGWCLESEVNYPRLRSRRYMSQFDLTMTYRWDSDIPNPYWNSSIRDALRQPPAPKTASAPVVYFASNDNDRSGRTAFVRELMRHIPVHSYGKSLQNRQLLEDRGIPSKLKTIARYKFTLALENSISHDYVTEKFFQPLTVGSVPVYRGAPNVDEFAPGDRCFINAASFAGPAELAQYLLALDQNDSEYESYLEWKRQPFAAAFLEKAERTAELPFCRLCRKLREML